MKKVTTEPVFARMPRAEVAEIKRICRERDVTVSQVIRRLLRSWVESPETMREII